MRGQAHTLEATIGSILLLTSLLLALQTTTVTPLSASTSNQYIENQQESMARGALSAAAEREWVKRAVLYWDNQSAEYHGAGDIQRGYSSSNPAPEGNEFDAVLEETFSNTGIAYNVHVAYNKSGNVEPRQYVYRGVPTDKSVTVSRTVALMDGDRLVESNGSRSSMTVAESGSFYIDDEHPNASLYNVVSVEVTAWRN